MRLAFLLFLLGCFGTAHAGWFGPKNYDECILENMKGVTLKQAVWEIQKSCRAKFPEACYVWQKKQAAKPATKPWERYANQRGAKEGPRDSDKEFDAEMRALMSGFGNGQAEPAAPDGCYAVLDR